MSEWKRDLHRITVETDEGGIVESILLDGEPIRGCTGLEAKVGPGRGFLNVTIHMEADSIEGLPEGVCVLLREGERAT